MTEDESTQVAAQLEKYLIRRDVRKGLRVLDRLSAQAKSIDPSHESAASLLFCVAQWIDLGYAGTPPLERLFEDLSKHQSSNILLLDFLKIRAVEAFANLRSRRFARAILLLDTTLGTGEGAMSPYQTFVSHFWLGRAHRLAGNYEKAFEHICKARTIADGMAASKLVAVTNIHQSWLLFHRGERESALVLLDKAEEELRLIGHDLSLANISAARGRFIRSTGAYSEALAHFERAIEIYLINHPNHPHLARAYVNAAYVKRLISLQHQHSAKGAPAHAQVHKVFFRIAAEAQELLDKAAAIYANDHHSGGTGAVLVNKGYLHLEGGDIESARQVAEIAYRLGDESQDMVLMGRASILLGSVELASSEEQLEEEEGSATHGALAVRHADHAVSLALKTQNSRLQAAAYIARGLIASDEANLDWALARDYAQRASKILGDQDRDHLFQELSNLKIKILRSVAVDETVRGWCVGELGGKTFQQVQEEFAEIVIPKVWHNMDRKVSRVAEALRISPKKIRRILRTAGYLKGD